MADDAAVYTEPRRVTESDLDERAHVNNVVYLRWVQEIATAHWRALATPRMLAELA